MSLVLAIQPDATQAERLTSVCRRIGAELVLAPSAPEALAALGVRIPDVILSAPLLPASDEAAIAERLRDLGDEALHVQALAAPLLGEPAQAPAPERRGLLGALRKPRRVSGPAVCDPLAFAGELSCHLLRAVAERASITAEPIEAPSLDDAFGARGADDASRPFDAFDAWIPRSAEFRRPQEPDIDLTPVLDALAADDKPRTRKTRRRKARRTYDDAAYFDPERCEFAAVVDRFDEFVQAL